MPRTMLRVTPPPSPSPITCGADLRAARIALGLGTVQLAQWLGHQGTRDSLARTISQLETDQRPIPIRTALLVECFVQGARPSSAMDEIAADPPAPPTKPPAPTT